MNIELLVLRGAMPSSVALTWDVLATANLLAPAGRAVPFQVRVSGSAAEAWATLLDAPLAPADGAPDLLIMPGLGLARADDVSTRLDAPDALATMAVLRAAAERGVEIATSCSGAFLLARAGLLDGRRATTSWWLAPAFKALHPGIALVMDDLILRDGPITTAGASMAQMDLMLNLVARFAGPALASRCSQYLLLDERRSQSRYMALNFLAAADEHVARAETWARAHLAGEVSVDDLAAAAGLAPRTFARRLAKATGMSPIRFLQRLRIEAARELIETTRLPVDEIAHQVGYADPSALRRLMGRELGLSPSHVRRRSPAPFGDAIGVGRA